MRTRLGALLLALAAFVAACGAFAAIDPLPFADDAERDRFRALAGELRCMVCQNQSLADSDAPLARDLRRELHELMRSGRSDDEIKAYLTDRYGDFVLYRPPLDRRTWWLWFGPAALAIVALAVVALVVRRRRRDVANTALQPMENEEW
jgi:cytochrome c-type biogenesis protein CcmH